MEYLNRAQAPIDAALWQKIDATSVSSAAALLTGRCFLEVEGPYGPGLTSLEIGHDKFCRETHPDEAVVIGSMAIAVPMLRKKFKLSVRRLAAYVDMQQPLHLTPVSDAAEQVARREEELIYHGQATFNLPGLLTVPGAAQLRCAVWDDLEQALQTVLQAVTALDNNHAPGPYALALAPALYNGLYRRYQGTDMLQVEHLSRLCENGVYKAPIDGAVLIDARAAHLVVGQDLRAGYVQQDGVHCDMFLSESIALVIDEPSAICVIATS